MTTGRKTQDSRIKGVPNRIILNAENGDKVVYVQTSLLRGECQKCGQVVYVESNIGVMCCCHCAASPEEIRWTWGEVKIVFIPTEEVTKPGAV